MLCVQVAYTALFILQVKSHKPVVVNKWIYPGLVYLNTTFGLWTSTWDGGREGGRGRNGGEGGWVMEEGLVGVMEEGGGGVGGGDGGGGMEGRGDGGGRGRGWWG